MADASVVGPVAAVHAPVKERARVDAVDAARGFALLGIFCVNIQFFAEPFGRMVALTPTGSAADRAVFYFVHILCMGKFYGLFSLLFGIGFALMRARAKERGGSWPKLYARRVLFLGVIGLAHALLIWYGDILFMYAVCALLLLAFGGWSARTLAIIGASIIMLATLAGVGLAGLSALGQAQRVAQTTPPQSADASAAENGVTPEPGRAAEGAPPEAAPATPPAEPEKPKDPFWQTPFGQLIDGFRTQQITDPSSELWQGLETQVYQKGPYSQMFYFRAFTWLMSLSYSAVSFGWTILAMFCIGAALAKSNFFGRDARKLQVRLALIGLLVGLPICALGVIIVSRGQTTSTIMLHTFCQIVGAPLMSLGYLAGMTLLVNAGACDWLTKRFMLTGRMALTNYLTHSVVSTAVFYYWGLGYFGTFTRAQQMGFVAGLYLLQLFVISPLWLGAFKFGPMEWLWRSFTYLRLQPMRRTPGATET